jgi:AraC family transcriptional regulator, L-rhamnose operon transcriptional activator RhaR
MADPPVQSLRALLHFVDGSVAYAGHYLHQGMHPVHTHSFVEVAVVTGGAGVHISLAGGQELTVGDVILLRPGVWHGYDECIDLDVYNCCFSSELQQRELGWTRDDPLLGRLLWTGPYSGERRGILTTHLDPDQLEECVGHLDALAKLRLVPVSQHRGDIVGRLALFLSCVARSVVRDEGGDEGSGETHPAVVGAMRLLEERPEHGWTLRELAENLHLAPGYLVRLFKSATGLPPMTYLARHRVEVAAARLLHTDQPINRIGESVGWPDQNYFARRFRAHYGMSASTYRARFTGNTAGLKTMTGAAAEGR